MGVAFSSTELEQYRDRGFLVVEQLFAPAEIAALRVEVERDSSAASLLLKRDRQGNQVALKMWNRPGNDLLGMFSRNERVVDKIECLLREAVYLYSAKMTMKNAGDGGAWEWHQDYGYWYNYGCLFPTMASCLIAVDRSTRENGCLQVLSGSQRLGRIDHSRTREQMLADEEHVEAAKKIFERVYVELEAGDAVFFDCNLLHRSDANQSENRRWHFICSYNAVNNVPYKCVRDYGNYEPLIKVPRSSISEFIIVHHAE